MIRYILLVFNIIFFTFIFSILIIIVGLFDKTKKNTGYLTQLSILNYPEGTRTGFNRLNNFKKGGFVLAIQSKYPILPLTIVYSKYD